MDKKTQSRQPRILVISSLFPHKGAPGAGVFIRERMFRVGKFFPLVVISPVPWFPFQNLIRIWRPHYRIPVPYLETQNGISVYHPRFISVPGLFRFLDGLSIAICSLPTLVRLKKNFSFNIIDAHFGYPDGYAATLVGNWLKCPVTITLRGTEVPLSRTKLRRRLLLKALQRATRIFSVADALKQHVVSLGANENKIQIVANGVDARKFEPIPKAEARKMLGLPQKAKVLVSVGGLVERKGFHRVIDCIPKLQKRFSQSHYLIVGGASPEGDWSERLKKQVSDLGLEEVVHFLGPLPQEDLKIPLSSADVFVLATRNEGCANVFLEAAACGLPVVTTDVGGNKEVISTPELGSIVTFGNSEVLLKAIVNALAHNWDRDVIMDYARANSWDSRMRILHDAYHEILKQNQQIAFCN